MGTRCHNAMRPSVPSDGNQVIVDAKNKTTLKKLLTPKLFLECCKGGFFQKVQ